MLFGRYLLLRRARAAADFILYPQIFMRGLPPAGNSAIIVGSEQQVILGGNTTGHFHSPHLGPSCLEAIGIPLPAERVAGAAAFGIVTRPSFDGEKYEQAHQSVSRR